MTLCPRTATCTRTAWPLAKARCHVDSDALARALDNAKSPAPPPPPAGHPLTTRNCSLRATNSTKNLFSRSPGLPTMVKLPVTTWAQNGTLMHRKCPRQHPQRYFLSYSFILGVMCELSSLVLHPQLSLFYESWIMGSKNTASCMLTTNTGGNVSSSGILSVLDAVELNSAVTVGPILPVLDELIFSPC
jgi:hypothetical protein